MSYPSQVIMNDVPLFMTQGYIMNVIQKLGHHPVRAAISKDKRSSNSAVCTIQFANVDAAKEAVSKLNGNPVSISGSGSTATTFKLTQGADNGTKLYNVLVGELAPEIDDFRLFKFFGDRFKSLCDAKVIVDSDGKSRGFGFLAFTNEEDQKFCVKIMDGSLDLGNRAIKVSTVVASPPVSPIDLYAFRIMSGDPWCRYTSWNQFIEPPEYPFISVKVNLTACKESKDGKDIKDTKDSKIGKEDADLVKYNVTSNTDYLNLETLERDCHFWDALECSKWLPLMALNLPPSDYADPPAESEAQTTGRRSESNHGLSNGTASDSKDDSKNKNLKRSIVPSKSSTSRPSKVAKKNEDVVVKVEIKDEAITETPTAETNFEDDLMTQKIIETASRLVESIELPTATTETNLSSLDIRALSETLTKNLVQVLKSQSAKSSHVRVPSESTTDAFEVQVQTPAEKPSAKIFAATKKNAKKKEKRCFLCDDVTHLLRDCQYRDTDLRRCSVCQEMTTHKADDCPSRTEAHVRTDEQALPAPRNENLANPGKTCFRCDEVGHKIRDCPFAATGMKKCYTCNELSYHNGYECPLLSAKKANLGEKSCFLCDDATHLVRECPYRGSGLTKCGVCKEMTSHDADDCPSRVEAHAEPETDASETRRKSRKRRQFFKPQSSHEGAELRKCFFCQEFTTHKTDDCPFQVDVCSKLIADAFFARKKKPVSNPDPALRSVRCYQCGDRGHYAPDCPYVGWGLKKCYNCQFLTTHKAVDCPYPTVVYE